MEINLAEIVWNFHTYQILRFVHICSVIVWTGTTIAGTWYVLCAKKYSREKGEGFSELELWVRRRFLLLINVEHIAFVVLVGSAIWLAFYAYQGLFQVFFVQWKFLILLIVLLPMEITDVILTNFILSPALKKEPEDKQRVEKAILYHDRFYFAMTFILAVILPVMFYLAIFKPFVL